jgi:hypothetical protein
MELGGFQESPGLGRIGQPTPDQDLRQDVAHPEFSLERQRSRQVIRRNPQARRRRRRNRTQAGTRARGLGGGRGEGWLGHCGPA